MTTPPEAPPPTEPAANLSLEPLQSEATQDAGQWLCDWMSRNDVVLKHRAFQELIDALAARPAPEAESVVSIVNKYRFAADRPMGLPTDGKTIQVLWNDFLELALHASKGGEDDGK